MAIKKEDVFAMLIMVVGTAVIVALLALISHWVYGDWTCILARCVKVKDVH